MHSALSCELLSQLLSGNGKQGGDFAASAVELPIASTLWTKFATKTLKSDKKMRSSANGISTGIPGPPSERGSKCSDKSDHDKFIKPKNKAQNVP